MPPGFAPPCVTTPAPAQPHWTLTLFSTNWVITQSPRFRPSTIPRKSECRFAANIASKEGKVRVGIALSLLSGGAKTIAYRCGEQCSVINVTMGPTSFPNQPGAPEPALSVVQNPRPSFGTYPLTTIHFLITRSR